MARSSIYPPSVTPGNPQLGERPSGWIKTTFGDVLKPVYRKADLEDDADYQLVIAKRNREGIVPRSVLKGREIKTKTQFYLRTNDFLIAKRQIIHGACGIVPPELDGSIVSNEYVALNPKAGLLLDFLKYYCHTIHFQQTCFQSSIGVDVEKMIFKLDQWFKWPLYLPPLPEQRKIAAILSTWDEAIMLTERLITALQQRKRGLMQRLLTGQVRFPGFVRSHKMQETRYGEIPAEWDVVRIADVVVVNAENLSDGANEDHEYFYIDLSAVNQGAITFPALKQRFGDLPSRARRVLHFRDVIMATVRPNLLGYALCDFDPVDVLCSTGFALISPNDLQDSDLLYQNLYSDTIQRQVHGMVTGSNYPAINSSDVQTLVVFWPQTSEERQSIGDVLRQCDQEIADLNMYADCLKTQKKGLMQQLLTGQLRVAVDESA